MSEQFGAGSGLISLVIFLIYQFLSHRKKKAPPIPSRPTPEPLLKIPTPPKIAKALPVPHVKNPVYIPKKTSRKYSLKSKREMIILSAIYKNPYS